ncbi:FAD-dependent oxidoreductase [Tomitella biformata]|uniref:FAD-dependent oxidoreductase n=1 Tax=Tomitella biformata TaxID=630403 RepID=UPI000464749B|nr:FAD-dependent oxidoreductase [Tomitella biformata]
MPHVVTQPCCSDASCVYACPVNCIHPTPDEPDFLTAEMLHIDPEACVDCGACVSACPVDAIVPEAQLLPSELVFLDINASFYRERRDRPILAPVIPAPVVAPGKAPLRVAIVGSGPSAMYAADELLTLPGTQVNIFDRLPVPYGLVRAGVAPDHQRTKGVTKLFDKFAEQDGLEYYLNVEIGADTDSGAITHDELLAGHHAVIYAVGASSDRKLGIPGEGLPGSSSATDFVAWYNGDARHSGETYDLSHRRAVIIGNGNVALDVARILTVDPETLAGTDISRQALEALRASKIEEVVIIGRRGPGQSAFTVPEFAGLIETPGIDVAIHPGEDLLDADTKRRKGEAGLSHAVEHKLALLDSLDARESAGGRTITLRYLLSPTEITGDDAVTGIVLSRNAYAGGAARIESTDETVRLDAGLVLTSIGYRGVATAGVPFDEAAGVIPNAGGRVLREPAGEVLPGAYVTGWIKRGPSGFIGTNKSCAQETVNRLVDDYNDGELTAPATTPREFDKLVRRRQPTVVDRAGWHAIDRAERELGARGGRVREKITDPAALVEVAAQAAPPAGARKLLRSLRR